MPCPSHSPWLDHSNYIWRKLWLFFQILEIRSYMLTIKRTTEKKPKEKGWND
jgi:hypothetical protein